LDEEVAGLAGGEFQDDMDRIELARNAVMDVSESATPEDFVILILATPLMQNVFWKSPRVLRLQPAYDRSMFAI
jgi:hypothetical protein